MTDTDLYKETAHVNEILVVVNNNFTKLDKTEF